MRLIGSGDSENSFGKLRKGVKLKKRKPLVIVAGDNLAEIPPPLALSRNCRFLPRCDSSELAIGEIVSGEVPQSRKIGKAEDLVIVAGDLGEIRPPLAMAKNCRF